MVKLVHETLSHSEPTFTGIPAELRQQVFEKVLSVSQHPESTDEVFYLDALRISRDLHVDAKHVLRHSNLFIRVTVYDSDSDTARQSNDFVRLLAKDIYTVLEPNVVDNLEIEPAVHLMFDHESTVHGPKIETSFLFAYNEATLATIVLKLFDTDFPLLSIKFRSPFAAFRHRHAGAGVIQYLGYLRFRAFVTASEVCNHVNSLELKQKISSNYSTYEDFAKLLNQIQVKMQRAYCKRKNSPVPSQPSGSDFLCGTCLTPIVPRIRISGSTSSTTSTASSS